LDEPGTDVNSPALFFRGDDGGVEEEAQIILAQGADPYLRISVDSSNTQGLGHVMDIHDQVIAFSYDNQTDIGGAADNRPKDIHAAGDVGVGDDVLLATGAVVGITGEEIITFTAGDPGTINFSGASVDVDGAFTATSVTSDAGIGLTGDITLAAGANRTISVATDNTEGDQLSLVAGSGGTGAVNGGAINVTGGAGGSDGNRTGGAVYIAGGVDGGTSVGGAVYVRGGAGNTNGIVYLGDSNTASVSAGIGLDMNSNNITEIADLTLGIAGSSEARPTLSIIADADADAEDTDETLAVVLTQNANPTLATWGWTTTQSAGMDFDMPITASTVSSDAQVTAATVFSGPELTHTTHITVDPAGAGATHVDIANSGAGAATLWIEGDQVNSGDLSDVASIGMLDEAEALTETWAPSTDEGVDWGSSTNKFNHVYGDTAHFNHYGGNSAFTIGAAGDTLTFSSGTNASCDSVLLTAAADSIIVTNTMVTGTSYILVTPIDVAPVGHLVIKHRAAGTFTIWSSGDESVDVPVAYFIMKP